MAESLLPLIHDPNSAAGREALNLTDPVLSAVQFTPFRLRPGDDTSCLNLYQPSNPRILAPAGDFLSRGRFSFEESLAQSADEKNNPWLLLQSTLKDGAIPAIADSNSIEYVLHRKVGEDVVLTNGDRPLKLRLVAALSDSIFQGELLISEANFLRLFPDQAGVPVLPDRFAGRTIRRGHCLTRSCSRRLRLRRRLNRQPARCLSSSREYLPLDVPDARCAGIAARHGGPCRCSRVGTYCERRRELALLSAVGYRRSNLATMILAENALILVGGLAIGAACALIAITPAIASRGGHVAAMSMLSWLGIILVDRACGSVGSHADHGSPAAAGVTAIGMSR